MSGSDLYIPRNETVRSLYFQNRITMFCLPISNFPHSCTCEQIIYSHNRSAEAISWENKNCSQIHECRNWEQGRAVSFLGIYVSIFDTLCTGTEYLCTSTVTHKQPYSLRPPFQLCPPLQKKLLKLMF